MKVKAAFWLCIFGAGALLLKGDIMSALFVAAMAGVLDVIVAPAAIQHHQRPASQDQSEDRSHGEQL